MSDDSDLTGKGHSILLPSEGNPFKKNGDEPADLSPADIESRFGKAAEPEDGVGGEHEPQDLSPDDIAALFPASQEERNMVPIPASVAEVPAPAGQPVEAPPPRMGARGALSQRLGAAVHHSDINIEAFDPDAPIDRPKKRGKVIRHFGKVDINSFDPDVPAGEAASPTETPVEPMFADSTPIMADSSAPEPSLVGPSDSLFTTDASAIRADAPLMDTAAPAEPFPAVETFTPSPAESIPFTPAVEPEPIAPSPEPAPEESAPSADFKPFDPFASSVASAEKPAPAPIAEETTASRPAPDAIKEVAAQDVLPTAPASSVMFPVRESEQMLTNLVTEDRIHQLWIRIDEAEKRAISDESSLPKQRTVNLENLRTARNILLGGREYYEDALRYVAEVEADLLYAGRVRKWSFGYGISLTIYNVLWLGLLFSGYVFAGSITGLASETVTENFGFVIWITVLAGGLGGVSKSMISLIEHISEQDFDSQHTLWYISSPLLGAVLGVFIWIFAQIALTGVNAAASAGSSGGAETSTIGTGGILLYSALAWLVGFQQNLVFELVDRLKKIILGEKDDNSNTTGKPSASS